MMLVVEYLEDILRAQNVNDLKNVEGASENEGTTWQEAFLV